MLYSIKYELKRPGQDYKDLYEAIKNLGAWWHYIDALWLADTNLSATQIFARLKPCLDQNDLILITSFGKDYEGSLPKDAWDWIKSRVYA